MRLAPELIERIRRADALIRPEVIRSPLSFSPLLSQRTGCEVYLKCDHLQPTGSFKYRGATYKLLCLREAGAGKRVITVSTGNHGQAVALAASLKGMSATVYAASTASPLKLEAMRALGAQVLTVDASPLEVELQARRDAERSGIPFVQPYNDIDVIAGQGTVGIEIADLPGVDAVYASVGGGGLIAGLGTALKEMTPGTATVGCWPLASKSLHDSLEAGRIVESEDGETLSDGTAGGIEPDTITFPLCQQVVDERVVVDELEIRRAMRLVAETDRWIIEGAAGVTVAGFLRQAGARKGQRVVLLLCGRNISLDRFLAAVA